MFRLPFLIPEDELELNLILVLMIVTELDVTSTGKQILDKERLQVYLYLVTKPNILQQLLFLLKKKSMVLKSYELLSFKAENIDIDSLYDTAELTYYLKILISKKFIDIKYNTQIGFVYVSTDKVQQRMKKSNSEYLNRVSTFINSLKQTRSIPISTITSNLKKILN